MEKTNPIGSGHIILNSDLINPMAKNVISLGTSNTVY
jgi:hypothetical protein